MANQTRNDLEKTKFKTMNSTQTELFFDGELSQEALANYSRDELDEIQAGNTFAALDEIRRVVRTESLLALKDIDGYDLLDAIHGEIDKIDAAKKPVLQEPALPSVTANTARLSSIVRWIPAFAAAALFMLSIPGLVTMFAPAPKDAAAPQPTVVYVDGRAAQTDMCPQKSALHEAANADALALPVAKHDLHAAENVNSDQLTVEEMDHAIRLLIKRIDTLEEANRRGVENGDIAIDPAIGADIPSL